MCSWAHWMVPWHGKISVRYSSNTTALWSWSDSFYPTFKHVLVSESTAVSINSVTLSKQSQPMMWVWGRGYQLTDTVRVQRCILLSHNYSRFQPTIMTFYLIFSTSTFCLIIMTCHHNDFLSHHFNFFTQILFSVSYFWLYITKFWLSSQCTYFIIYTFVKIINWYFIS